MTGGRRRGGRFPLAARFGIATHGLFGAMVVASVVGCGDAGPAGPGDGGEGLRLRAVAGQEVRAPAGTVLPEGPTVVVRNAGGEPVPGVAVDFRVVEGGGRVDPSTDTTDASGRARTGWILGPAAGAEQTVEASAGAGSVRIRAAAGRAAPGERYEGWEGRTAWLAGDLPLILSAPHGGDRKPFDIPERTWGSTVKDLRTLELALLVRARIEEVTGRLPHLVISRLHRIKLDPNREIVEAAQGHPRAERAWHEYHAFLEAAQDRVEEAHGAGLLLDVHGHSHELPRVELGYLLTARELALSDSALTAGGYAGESSVRSLAARSPEPFPELLRGEKSLGGLLSARGVTAVPAPSLPNPGGFAYWTGGYITRRHGSVDGGAVSAIQLEHPMERVRETGVARREYATVLTDALLDFFPAHFGATLAAGAGERAVAPQSK